jgi:glycine betaine/choline ABC-type transport system substrate-binding protein
MTGHHPRLRVLLALVAALALALVVSACGSDDESSSGGSSSSSKEEKPESSGKLIENNSANASKTLTIGSKNFTEEFILGEIYAQALEAGGYKVKKELNLGSEQIAFKAVKSGQVDAYPEYTGTSLTSFFDVKTDDVPTDSQEAYEQAKADYAKEGLTALAPTPFTNSNAVGMTQAKAKELGVTKISDLADKASTLTLSGAPECRQRTDCKVGLEQTYGLKFKKFLPVDPALRHKVLTSGQADVSIVFGTDGQIAADKLVVLQDDKKLFPPYNVSLIVNDKSAKEAGADMPKIVEAVQKDLTAKVMQELNSRVDLDKEKPADVAREYLQSFGYTEKSGSS